MSNFGKTPFFSRLNPSPGQPCKFAAEFQQDAESIFQNIRDTTSPEQFAKAQQSLLFLYQETLKKKALDPLHFRIPGRHTCLDQAYVSAAVRLRNIAILIEPPSAPPPKPRSLDDVLRELGGLPENGTGG